MTFALSQDSRDFQMRKMTLREQCIRRLITVERNGNLSICAYCIYGPCSKPESCGHVFDPPKEETGKCLTS